MRIERLRVHNFRSIQDIDLTASSMMVLLGPNNHGKSNILGAVEFVLSTSFKIAEDDFFAFRAADDQELWVEVTFADLTDQERTTLSKYVQSDGTVTIRKTARLDESGAVHVIYQGQIEEPDLWWLKESAFERLNSREAVLAEMENVPELVGLLEGGGRITKQRLIDFQNDYITAHRADITFRRVLEDGPLLGAKNVGGGILPDYYLIPAVRDLGDETKIKGTTIFGRLLQRAIADMTEHDPRVADIRDRISTLVSELNARPEADDEPSQIAALETAIARELTHWNVDVGIRVAPPDIETIFELGTELRLNDGHDTLAERKGHGLQRALIFALIKAWATTLRAGAPNEGARARKASESVVFAFEEPELFLHPHAQRTLAESLRLIAKAPQHQVLITTHSTHFVDLDEYRSIAIVSKESPQDGTQVRQCIYDLFEGEDAQDKKDRFHMATWINPDRSELFFARKTILVEGETEKAVLPYLAARIGCYDPNVSVIDCGSKHNLPLYIRVLNAFSIPYTVIHDEDPLPDPIPDDWNEDKIRSKRRTFELNEVIRELIAGNLGSVEMCSPDFERVAGVPRSQGEKKGKPIAALEHLERKRADELPTRLVEIVRAAFATAPMVVHGTDVFDGAARH